MPGPRSISKIFAFFKSYVWLLIIGGQVLAGLLLLIGSALLYVHPAIFDSILALAPRQWAAGLRTLGSAALASGFFAATLKAFQFSNIFREELVSVLYDPDQLAGRKDIVDIWSGVSKVLYDKRFPEISDELHSVVLSHYFPVNSGYYYDYVKEDMTYIPVEGKAGYYDQKVEVKLSIKAHDTSEIVVPYSILQYCHEDGDDDTYFSLTEVKINNKPETTQYQQIVSNSASFSGGCKRTAFDMKMGGFNKYTVYIRSTRRSNFEFDNSKAVQFSRFVRRCEIVVRYPKDLLPEFFQMGTTEPFSDDDSNEDIMRRVNKSLIFPMQGYRIFLRRR